MGSSMKLPLDEERLGDDWRDAPRRQEQVLRQHTWISGQFTGISNGLTRFKDEASGMARVQNEIMTKKLGAAYDGLYSFVDQLCELEKPESRLQVSNHKLWKALGQADDRFHDVVWELDHSAQALSDAAVGAMQQGDSVKDFMKRWHDFQSPLLSERDEANRLASLITLESVRKTDGQDTGNVWSGMDEIQRLVGVMDDRQKRCKNLGYALEDVNRQMSDQLRKHPNMVQQYNDMYNSIIDDKNLAFDMWGSLSTLKDNALEAQSALSTRDGALNYVIDSLHKERNRDVKGNTVVPAGIDKIFKLINEKLKRNVS